MKWGEFKAAVEAQGVNDKTNIAWIDYDGSEHLKVTVEDSRGITVVESWFPDLDKQSVRTASLPAESSDVI